MSNDQIKERSEGVETGKPDLEQVEKTLATLPPAVQHQIRNILEDRIRASTNSRFTRKWTVVDIIVKTKVQPPVSVWMMLWRETPEFSEALFILKGENADKAVAKPSLREDPFRKPRYRRRFEDVRYVDRDYPREEIVEPRIRLQPRHGSMDAGGRVTEIPDAPSLEEAEAKIQGILVENVGSQNDENNGLVSD